MHSPIEFCMPNTPGNHVLNLMKGLIKDPPPVDITGKLIVSQLPVHYCGALYFELQVFQSDT